MPTVLNNAPAGDFERDLQRGEASERLVMQLLHDAGFLVRNGPSGYFPYYDCIAYTPHPKLELVEVKDETNHSGTGRLCLEMAGPQNRPSGFMLTEATVCVHLFSHRAVLFRSTRMRLFLMRRLQLLEPGDFGPSRFGEGNTGFLLPIAELERHEWAEHLPLYELPISRVWRPS